MGFFIWASGATPALPAASATGAPLEIVAELTGYNAVPEQTDTDPEFTASGVRSNPEIIAARSRDMADKLPYGTVVVIELSGAERKSCGFSVVNHLIGYRVITDSMHARKEQQIDVLFHTDHLVKVGNRFVNPAVAVGKCAVTVKVVGKIPLSNIPKTQAELSLLVSRTVAVQ